MSKKSWMHFKSIHNDFIKTAKVVKNNNKNEMVFGLALNGVLSRSRKYVKTVDFDLSVVNSNQVTDFFNCLLIYCKKLERFAIDGSTLYGDVDNLFKSLFKRNRKLRSVVIPNAARITGECLMNLEGNYLTEINLRIDSRCIKMDLLQKAFSNFVNLQILGIEADKSFSIEAVLKVITNRRDCKLEELQIVMSFDDEEQKQEEAIKPNYSKYFSEMKRLVKISLSRVTLTKCSLRALPIESLTTIILVYFKTNVYAEFLFFLKNCKNLENFILHVDKRNEENPIQDDLFDSLSRCSKLNYLYLINCKNVSDAGIAKLANMLNMKKLEVERSPGVTVDFVKSKFHHLEIVKINGAFL